MPTKIKAAPIKIFLVITSPKNTAPQNIPVTGTKKIIEEAWTGEDLWRSTTYAMKDTPVETSPRKKIAKIICGDRFNENSEVSIKIKGKEKKNPEIIVTDAKAADLIWLSLKRILFE